MHTVLYKLYNLEVLLLNLYLFLGLVLSTLALLLLKLVLNPAFVGRLLAGTRFKF